MNGVNGSICEQTFSWFGNYAHVLNMMSFQNHRFYVLHYCRPHNANVDAGDIDYWNASSNLHPTMLNGAQAKEEDRLPLQQQAEKVNLDTALHAEGNFEISVLSLDSLCGVAHCSAHVWVD